MLERFIISCPTLKTKTMAGILKDM